MIPQNMKARARIVTLISFGVVILGALFSTYWVSLYAPK
jgi:hypothetical protein